MILTESLGNIYLANEPDRPEIRYHRKYLPKEMNTREAMNVLNDVMEVVYNICLPVFTFPAQVLLYSTHPQSLFSN
jgi:hypothetical protein